MCNDFGNFSEKKLSDEYEKISALITDPKDGLDSFFLISFCVSRKNNAYGDTGLNEVKEMFEMLFIEKDTNF